MLRSLAPALLAATLALPRAADGEPTPASPAEPPGHGRGAALARAEGRVESGAVRVEILGRPARVGETLELPEGFIRVEEQGTEDREAGSFSVVPAETLRPTAAALASAGAAVPEPRGAPETEASLGRAAPRDCRRERAAYLRELWRASGIEVDDPAAVIEGLEAGAEGPATGYYWFALATDPFRPLAWSSDLRSLAGALARCVRGEQAADDHP